MYYENLEFHFDTCHGFVGKIAEQAGSFLATKHSHSYGAKQKTGRLPSILATGQGRY